MNKAALFYVEQTVPMHTVLFYVWAQMFVLISCSLSPVYTIQTNPGSTRVKTNTD